MIGAFKGWSGQPGAFAARALIWRLTTGNITTSWRGLTGLDGAALKPKADQLPSIAPFTMMCEAACTARRRTKAAGTMLPCPAVS